MRLRHIADLTAQFAVHTAQRRWCPDPDVGLAWCFELPLSHRLASEVPQVGADMAHWFQQVLDRHWQRIDAQRMSNAASGHGWLLPQQMTLHIRVPAHSSGADRATVVLGFANGCRVERVARCGPPRADAADSDALRFAEAAAAQVKGWSA